MDKFYVSPEGQQFQTWADVQDHCKLNSIAIEAALDEDDSEPDFDLTDMLLWLHAAAANSPEWPAPGGGPLMQLAFARARAALSIDDMGSVYALTRRFTKV